MTLQIINLQAENYKRIKAVNITPEGNMVFIGGRNAQGKTSILDAIWAALAGGEASRATQQPIRDGQDTAVVRLDLGEYIVTRRWTKDDAGTLTVETPPNADGRALKYSSPQKLLDEIVGKRSFDPLAFTRQSAAEQIATLVATVDLPFDPKRLDMERGGVFEQRADTNRTVKQLEGQLAGLVAPNSETPTEEVSAAGILAGHEAGRAHNVRVDMLENQASSDSDELTAAAADVERLTAAIARLTEELAGASDYAARMVETSAGSVAAAKTAERVDLDAITSQLATVERTNIAIREGTEHRRVAAILASKRQETAHLTAELQKIDKKKSDALAQVKFPVDGLSFDSSGVTFNGIPFGQASAAEQLRVSAALAMAAEPTLRILQVRDGSLLDEDSMRILSDLAVEKDYQLFVEVVGESRGVGVVIEDGSVKSS